VARIDAPRPGDVAIAFLSQPTIIHGADRNADVAQLSRCSNLRASHFHLLDQLKHFYTSSIANLVRAARLAVVLNGSSLCPFLFRVKHLGIYTTRHSIGQDDLGGEQWLELVRSFRGARDFCVGDGLTTYILCTLGPADRWHTTVLPFLCHLRVENPMAMNEPSWDALHSFIASRALSGRLVQVNLPSHMCAVCHAGFRSQQGLERHLVNKHVRRMMCSYCSDFELTPGLGRNYRFRRHLESHHPNVVLKDGLLKSFTPFQLESLVSEHRSLRAPDIVASSTTVTAPRSQ
jgi:hypothetical protein